MARHRGRAWGPALMDHCAGLIRDALRETLAFLAPVACAGCGEPDVSVCASCRTALPDSILTRSVSGVPVFSAVPYAGTAKRMLLALKRDGRVDAAPVLGGWLADAVEAALDHATGEGIELAVVPASWASRQARGFVPVRLIVRRAGFAAPRVLSWARRPRDQIGLGRAERRENLTGAATARGAAGRRFIVVDDVVTTGATLDECMRALRQSGAEIVACATVASTLKHTATPREKQCVTTPVAGATVYEKA